MSAIIARHFLHTAQRSNEVVVAAWLISDTDRRAGGEDYLQIRVGVRKEGKIGGASARIDYLGRWDQATHRLRANMPLKITGQQDLFYPLAKGDSFFVEVSSAGEPVSEVGLSVEMEGRRVGSSPTEVDRRPLDADLAPPRRPGRPLFSLGQHVRDANVRQAVEVIENDLNTTGVTSFYVTCPLAAALSYASADAQDADNDTDVGATDATYQDLAEVTLTPPDARAYQALIWGRSSYEGTATIGNLRIRQDTDGTNGDSAKGYSGAAGQWAPVATFYTEVVQDGKAKTFKLQGNGGTGGNWDDHQIVGYLVPVEHGVRRLAQ